MVEKAETMSSICDGFFGLMEGVGSISPLSQQSTSTFNTHLDSSSLVMGVPKGMW